MPKEFGLSKAEKLKSRKLIQTLFTKGNSFLVFPVRFTWMAFDDPEHAGIQVGFSASKKNFKKAVERNRIKRLLREAYRLEKKDLLHSVKTSGRQVIIFFLFSGKELPTYAEIQKAMTRGLEQLRKKLYDEKPL